MTASSRGVTALATMLVLVVVAVVTAIAPAPSANAQVACSESMSVATAAELNAAVTCYNDAAAGTGPYTISLTANIDSGNNRVTAIAQPDAATALALRGNGYTITGGRNPERFLVTVSGPGEVTLESVTITARSGAALAVVEDAGEVAVRFSTISSPGEDAIFMRSAGLLMNPATLEVWHSSVVGGISISDGVFGFFHSVAADAEFSGITLTESTAAINNSIVTRSGESGLRLAGAFVVMGYSTISNTRGIGVEVSAGPGPEGLPGSLFLGNSTISGTGRTGVVVDAGRAIFEHVTIDNFVIQTDRRGPSNVRFDNSIVTGGCNGLESISPSRGNFVSAGSPACGDDSQELNEVPLGPLADNGCSLVTPAGCVLTHALLAGSNAIDVVVDEQCVGGVDQRGFRISPVPSTRRFPRQVGVACDAGAFEFGSGIDDALPTPPSANAAPQIDGPGTITDGGTGPVAPFGFGTAPEIGATTATATTDAATSTNDPDRANISFTG